MSDFPDIGFSESIHTTFTYPGSPLRGIGASSTGTWPVANRAIYAAVHIRSTVTVYKMGLIVGVQSGNLDVGIYSETGTRLVSSGSTAVAAAGLQVVDIADTTLTPGLYYLALCIDNTTASVFRNAQTNISFQQVVGIRSQAVGAVTLPTTATFANHTSQYVPLVVAFSGSSVV
jgi:hypothetical protein